MSDTQYEKRDAAFDDYFQRNRATADIHAAFNAGWEARKRAEYDMMIERVADHVHEAREKRR
jgi:hypothetical protein